MGALVTDSSTAAAHGSRVLQVGPLQPALAEMLARRYDALVLPGAGAERETFLAEHAGSVDVVVTSGRGGGERADGGAATLGAADVLTDCVADTAVGLTIDVYCAGSAAQTTSAAPGGGRRPGIAR